MDNKHESVNHPSLDEPGDDPKLEESGDASNSRRPRTSCTIMPGRFPKMQKETQEPPKSSRSVPYVVGLPQMSTGNIRNATPRNPSTYTNQIQSESAEALPTVWEERHPYSEEGAPKSGRSRSLNQTGISQQQKSNSQCPNNRRRYNSGSVEQRNKGASHSSFNRVQHIRGLPREISQKIIEEAPGTIITDYFGHGLTVARLRQDNIMEFGMCHIVFTSNPNTSQYWLKAFSKKTRSQEGNLLKFNRLLTSNMNLEYCGKTAFIIGPTNGKPNYLAQNEEKHMFNFFEEVEATRFGQTLEKASKQVWNHAGLQHSSSNVDVGVSRSRKRQELLSGSGSHTSLPATRAQSFSRPNSAGFRSSFQQQDRHFYSTTQTNEALWALDSDQFQQAPSLRFLATRVQIFVKIRSAYTLLGLGEISILKTPGGYDKLIFRGPRNEVICDHLIYSWNEPRILHQNSGWECTWSAAANLLIAINPKQMPAIRELKLAADQQELVLQFAEALQESVSAALAQTALATNPPESIRTRPSTSGL